MRSPKCRGEAYKRDNAVQARFHPHGALTYDGRIMSLQGLEHVSLPVLGGHNWWLGSLFRSYQSVTMESVQPRVLAAGFFDHRSAAVDDDDSAE